ncbi:MAG: hypothetical protein QNK37_27790 [Acidobacteriota bacterium]|nr:hypothetical protein [Acidobacteriota bacterium]
MANENEVMNTTIDDFLLSLAEGLVAAQEQLNQLPKIGESGRPLPAYYIPSVDFELRVALDFSKEPAPTRGFSNPNFITRQNLTLRPVLPSETTVEGFKGEVISTIKGSFVSVPPNEGRPGMVLQIDALRKKPREFLLTATVTNALREPLADVQVNFNLDPELSRELSAEDNVVITGLKPATQLQDGIVKTNEQGIAATTLVLSPGEPMGVNISLIIDAVNLTETLIVKLEP